MLALCRSHLRIISPFLFLLLIPLARYVTLFAIRINSSGQMTRKPLGPEPKKIVIIGGGVVGCSIAYFLTRHAYFNPKMHSIIILEASKIAGGSSGKAGGLLADWATPKCLAPLSFKTHAELAKKHGGDKIWGHRLVYCADIVLQAQELGEKLPSPSDAEAKSQAQPPNTPSDLDWLLPGSIKSYKESGTSINSGQVNPYLFTKTLAEFAEERGAKVVIGSATAINYTANAQSIDSVQYSQNGICYTLEATDIILSAGPWTFKLFPRAQLKTPRGHSVVVRPSRDLSPHVLFPRIEAPRSGILKHVLSPEIYPRPRDRLYDTDTVYASGPDDYDVPLPDTTDDVAVDKGSCNDIWIAIQSVSQEIHDGEILAKQACYKPQIQPHDEGEEVGPMIGRTGIEGLWLATGHDEWGIQNAPGTGLVMSEMIFEGAAHSANCDSLDPKQFFLTES